jgi:hypothetical protein
VTDLENKVLERLGTTESTTLAVKRKTGDKIRVASMLWEDARVILRGEVLVVRNVDGRSHIAVTPNEWTSQSSLMTLWVG